MRVIFVLVALMICSAAADVLVSDAATGTLTRSGPLVIDGQDGTIVDGVRISSRDGDCVVVKNSTNIIIRNSSIGPCSGRGIHIEGGSNVTITSNFIQTQFKPKDCCDKGDGIFAEKTTGLRIDGNKIAYSETNIELMSVQGATITNNSLANPLGPFPRGQQIQIASFGEMPPSRDVLVEGNTLLATRAAAYNYKENQEDAISLYFSEDVKVKNNLVQGGRSVSGCGILADDGSNGSWISGNRVYNTAQCGIGVASGRNQIVDANHVLLTEPVQNGGNTAIYVWLQYKAPCGEVTISNNIATFLRANGVHSGFWDGGGCEPVRLSNNTWDEDAYRILLPELPAVPERLLPEFVPLEHTASAPGVSQYLGPGLALTAGLFLVGAVALHVRGKA